MQFRHGVAKFPIGIALGRAQHCEGWGLTGAKPEKFSLWLFWLMGMRPEDELIDLFPGTEAVSDGLDGFAALPQAVAT